MNVGIDVGGSHIGIGLVNDQGTIERKEETYITEKEPAKVKEIIESFIINVLKSWKENQGIEFSKIGIAMPGVVINDIIEYCFNVGIEQYDLKSILQETFPECEIHIKNDAKCAALAEKNLGALRTYEDAVFMCLGTGIGGAAFYDGKLISPKRGPGFEYGHTVIKKDGENCKCGSKGCFERYGSMRALKSKIRAVLNLEQSVDGKELLTIVNDKKDDEAVTGVIDEFIDDLSVGISNMINILEPTAICIGGGFVEYQDILLDKLIKELNECDYIFYHPNMPKIMVAELGNNAGIIGSALFL